MAESAREELTTEQMEEVGQRACRQRVCERKRASERARVSERDLLGIAGEGGPGVAVSSLVR